MSAHSRESGQQLGDEMSAWCQKPTTECSLDHFVGACHWRGRQHEAELASYFRVHGEREPRRRLEPKALSAYWSIASIK
jgi:hypothetical protein